MVTRARTSAAAIAAEPILSVVIPFFNEEGSAGGLVREVAARLDDAGLERFELVAVNDGSSDGTGSALSAAADLDARIRVLTFGANRGQAAALLEGLRRARASIVVTMDGDGQNDPADIPALLRLLGNADLVVGYRQQRSDSVLRIAMSRLANRVRGALLRDGVRDSGCALKAMRREVVEALIPIRTLYSFIPALAAAAGFRVVEAPVNHRPRTSGTSSYGLRQFLWRPAVDMLGIWWFASRRIPLASTPVWTTAGTSGLARESSNRSGLVADGAARSGVGVAF